MTGGGRARFGLVPLRLRANAPVGGGDGAGGARGGCLLLLCPAPGGVPYTASNGRRLSAWCWGADMSRSGSRPPTLALELQRLRRSGMGLAEALELLAVTYPREAEVLRSLADRERAAAEAEARDSRSVQVAS